MSNKTDVGGKVPKRRFPEFQDSPDWKDNLLADICEMRAGKFVAAAEIHEFPGENLHPCFGGNGLRGYTKTKTRTGIYPLIGRQGALCGNVTLATGSFHATEHAVVASPREKVNVYWLFYLLKLMDLNQYATGQAQPGLSVETLEKILAYTPIQEEEQKKIGKCLFSIDELITAQTQKLEALQKHKQGLMRWLFPAEGETVPELRFPECRDAGDWTPTALGQIVDFQSGGTPFKGNSAFWNGSIPWVSAKDMKQLFLDDSEDHITTAAIDNGAKQAPAGTVLMLTRGMTLLKDVPICILNRPMSFNQDVKALHPKGDLGGHFLAYLLLASKQRLLSLVDIAGHGTGRLDTDELKSLDVMLPPPAEQRLIVACLISLDELITTQTKKLETLKTLKQGLMQQLFPSTDSEG